jgi:hypothetical protein
MAEVSIAEQFRKVVENEKEPNPELFQNQSFLENVPFVTQIPVRCGLFHS